jgi:hypothetical protein
MNPYPLTESELKSYQINEISILKIDSLKSVLVFIFDTKEESLTFLKVLMNSPFYLQIETNLNNQFEFRLVFTATQRRLFLLIKTGKTKEQYPPLGWLKGGIVNFCTCGTKERQIISYSDIYLPLEMEFSPN